MIERDELILKHIGKYSITTRAVLEKLFFDDGTCDHVLSRLIREKRIVSAGGIPGGLSYYRLSLTEARARGVPEHRARPKKGRALREALQLLSFCCLSEKARTKLERRQVAENFGNGSGSGKPHCAESNEDRSMVYRVYAPGPNSRDDYLLKAVRSDTEKGLERPELRTWIEAKAFAVAILVETPERQARLKRLISKTGPYGVWIHVEVVPGLTTLAASLRKRGEEKNRAD